MGKLGSLPRTREKGLMMYGQMTAGSWIYIGTQGILQGTYETFGEATRQHFDGSLKGTLTLTAGLGGMGGAQPLAVTMNGGVVIAIDVDKRSIDRRIEKRYCDMYTESLEEALTVANEYKEKKEPISIGLLGNAAEILPELVKRDITPDLVTDQTSAHDPLNGYIPVGYTLEEARNFVKRSRTLRTIIKRKYDKTCGSDACDARKRCNYI